VTKAALTADAFHVRAPGNIALVASLLVPLFQKRLVAKFAGQWIGAPGEARTVRWQRAILKSRWWRGPVTVYGDWPNQPPHIVPFFTSVLDNHQMARAQAAAANRNAAGWADRNLRLLYVGRLSASKNVAVVLEALAQLKPAVTIELDIVGDGPERAALERFVNEQDLRRQVRFHGNVAFDRVLEFYEQADALTLVSASEGWGKAITEAMAFGLVCIGSNLGVIPWLLGEGRGLVVPPNDATALASALREIAGSPIEHFQTGQRAAAWSQRFSLEGLGNALRELLGKHWRMPELNPHSDKAK
ncbi:MAG TPA: glycosyltransferase family 4 protein, partial [Blastocatellia bacterium]|nr:glycosyltransferase family 4 protein [Blastocatellia bacterium]